MYISQIHNEFFINILFDDIPTHKFLIDDQEVLHDTIKYRKVSFGHIVQVPVTKNNTKFEMKSGLTTLAEKKILIKESPEKLMMFSSFSPLLLNRVNAEQPDVLVVFVPPSTQYQTTRDFFKGKLFSQNELRPIHLVGEAEVEGAIDFKDFLLTNLKQASSIDKPVMITSYSPLANSPQDNDFQEISSELRRMNQPVVFLSSYSKNLIQQIPKGHVGFPSYEFSVKNQFLSFTEEEASPWEVLNELRSEYLILKMDFSGSYWHLFLQGKDENGDSVFERDLTLYKTKLK